MLNFTIIKLCPALIAGILLGFHFKPDPHSLWLPGLILLAGFIFSYFRTRRLFIQDSLFGGCVFLMFIFLGVTTASLNIPQNKPLHYINHIAQDSPAPLMISAEIAEKLKPGVYQDRYIIQVKELEGNPAAGKALLNLSREPEAPSLQPGEKILLYAPFTTINSPLNPHQFNYRKYMEDLGVLRQINTNADALWQIGSSREGLVARAGNIRAKIISGLRETSLGRDELAIVQALLLGQRQEISQEMYSNYTAAGVIHILAVSGLHVGIILLILNRLLQPLQRFPQGRFLKTVLLLMLMWGFAVLAGLSPSVVRAVSMFSFVAIGLQLKRRTSVITTLFASLLILLLINPGYISQVGFQLSYAAVFSIVLIQPHLFGIYKGESRMIKYFWGILSVTIAAQIGVLPLSLFYFNQFPGLFFISNLVILPFLGVILGVGILVMLLSLTNLLPDLLAEVFGKMISLLNQFVSWAASKEDFIFSNIGFSLLLLLSSYLLVITFIWLLKDFRYKSIMSFLMAILIFQLSFFYDRSSAENYENLVFHKSRNTVIANRAAGEVEIYSNLESPALSYSFATDYATHTGVHTITEKPLRNIYDFQGKTVLQIDSSGIYNIPGLQPEIIILTASPRINLDRLLQELTPEIIVADGSNYPSYIKTWKQTAANKEIPFHATDEKGAFIYDPKVR